MEDDPHRLTATEARQGQNMHVVRWMLIGGLCLVVPGLFLVWLFFAS